jgi:hypothetical protein
MKKSWIGLQAVLFFLTTVAIAAAEEAKGIGYSLTGYDGIYLIWKILAGGILVWGVYDTFFRQGVQSQATFDPKISPDPVWKLKMGKFMFYLTASAGVYFFYWFNVIQCPC